MSWWDLSDRCRQNKTGPQRSALSRSHGPFGRGLIFSGSRCMTGFLIAWHATHLPIILSNSSLMFGNQILERINYFVFLIPWCPSCAIPMARFLRFLSITIRFHRNKVLSVWTVSSSRRLRRVLSYTMSLSSSAWIWLILCHCPFLVNLMALWIVLSIRAANFILSSGFALGTEVSQIKFT